MISVQEFYKTPQCAADLNTIASYTVMVENMDKVSERAKKIEIIKVFSKDNEDLQKLISACVYANPKIKSQISAGDHKAFEKYMSNKFTSDAKQMVPRGGLLEMLRILVNRELTGDDAMHMVCSYISIFMLKGNGKLLLLQKFKPHLLDLLALDIGGRMKKCEIYDSYIAKHQAYIDSLVGNVTIKITAELGQKFEEKLFATGEYKFVSRKLDGVRCFAILDKKENKVTLKSRQNKVFTQFPQIQELLQSKLGDIKESVILDGEVCYMDDNDIEDFSKIQGLSKMKTIDRKETDHCIYYVFGYIGLEEMRTQNFTTTFSQSLARIHSFETSVLGVNKYIKILPHFDISRLDEMKKESLERGYEGLMIKKDDVYQPKRTHNLLKIKIMEDGEFKVIGVNIGTFNMQAAGSHAIQKPNMMLALVIDYKGNKVAVGSGFTLAQREEWGANPEVIKGKTIKVRYMQETSDAKTGLVSLRFPIFHALL